MRALHISDPLKAVNFIRHAVRSNRCFNVSLAYAALYGDLNTYAIYDSKAFFYKQKAEENRTNGVIQTIVDRFVTINRETLSSDYQ